MSNINQILKDAGIVLIPDRLEITTKREGVIPTGEYANDKPGFNTTISYLIAGQYDIGSIMKAAIEIQKQQYFGNDQAFKAVVNQSNNDMISRVLKNLRTYPHPNSGKLLVSVTTILSEVGKLKGEKFNLTPHDLAMCAAQGNINHAKLEDYINEGIWKKSYEIPRCTEDVLLLDTQVTDMGGKKLTPDYGDIEAAFKKYPFQFLNSEKTVYSENGEYAGTLDFDGITLASKAWDKVKCIKADGSVDKIKIPEGSYVLGDVKRTLNEEKNMKQMAAYAKSDDIMSQPKQPEFLCVCPINGKTQQGFNEFVVTDDIDGYYELFMSDRKRFKEVYGV